jgi:hypothetical protein
MGFEQVVGVAVALGIVVFAIVKVVKNMKEKKEGGGNFENPGPGDDNIQQ